MLLFEIIFDAIWMAIVERSRHPWRTLMLVIFASVILCFVLVVIFGEVEGSHG